ncbi:MAG: hypothetical protein L3J79_09540 [Candidatus Marinimicrobia bacterium]|nr:hypothetical protein [Candidatus Neomarinimicrobiota bacterium]
MTNPENTKERQGYCPVYDIECPAGSEAVTACEMRFEADYNPLTSFRDADIEHCAIYRKEQLEQVETEKNNSSENGE